LLIARHIRQSTNTTMRLGHPSMNHTQQQQQQQQPQQSQVHHGHLSPKQQHHHQQQASQPHCQMMATGHGHHGAGTGAAATQAGPRPSPSEHFICLELQKLHKEKERLQHQQEAITCRVEIY